MGESEGADFVRAEFLKSAAVKRQAGDALAGPVVEAAHLMAVALLEGRKVLVCGNGGSAGDAQHLAGEMVGRFKLRGRAPLPVLALNADSTVLTCIANDFSYEEVFSRQVEAFAQPGDVLIGISTSGRSANVLRAIEAGNARGATTIALVGGDGGPIGAAARLSLVVPSPDTARIQECHLVAIHAMCELLENEVAASTGLKG